MVLHEKGIGFEVHEVDLSNKSEEFLSVSPYGKVPVLSVNGTSLYESNVVNEYLDEVYESPKLMPQNPEQRALVRSWMAFADDYFFASVYRVRMGLQRGYSEDEIQEAKEKLYDVLSRLEHQLEGREYLVGDYLALTLRDPEPQEGIPGNHPYLDCWDIPSAVAPCKDSVRTAPPSLVYAPHQEHCKLVGNEFLVIGRPCP